MEKGLVSVITPTYNCAKFIGETIESVQAQTYQQWEMIIVDDCSTDNTKEIVDKYIKEDSRIKYFCLENNSGAAVARTKAMELANGEYMAFLDSDDIWPEEKLKKQLAFMKKHDVAFSCTAYEQIDENGKSLNKIIKTVPKADYNRVLLDCPVGNSTVMYNVEKMGKFEVPNIRKRNDDALWLRMLKKEKYIYGMKSVLMKYRIRQNSISSNKFKVIKYHWILYRNIEHLSIVRSVFHIAYWCVIKLLNMKISVLVPTLGTREKEIRRLLETLEKQSYKDFEIIFVTQDNHEIVKDIICKYSNLDIKQIEMSVKGLSRARNRGLEQALGEIVVLSDDDCWYPANAFEIIVNAFKKRQCAKIVLSQIFDPEKNIPYKNYTSNEEYVRNKLQLMSKSSIEVAFKKDLVLNKKFDERLGLGSEFVCGEEVDFLLSNYEKNAIFYIPEVTVYHKKKENGSSNKQIIAKGAIYGKNFNIFICLLVLLRDLMLKKENNFKYFFEGYTEYFKRTN